MPKNAPALLPESAQKGDYRFRRVWFVGAGFSAALGFPVGRGLIADLVEYLQGATHRLSRSMPQQYFRKFKSSLNPIHRTGDARRILFVIEQFSRRYLARSLAELADVDVAEFFSVAQALAEQLLPPVPDRKEYSSPETDGQFARLYHDLASVTRSYFIDITNAIGSIPADCQSVLRAIHPVNDVVVSFNWDEELDYFLSAERGDSFDIAYTAHSWTPNRFLILKPHGSIGWYDVALGLGNSDYYLLADHDDKRIPRSEKRLISLYDFELPLEISTSEKMPLTCPPVITPPTFGKRFPYPEQRLIWGDVIDVCRHAEQFVFLGYSLPPDDFLTRAAIRCSRAEKRDKNRSDSVPYLVVTRFEGQNRLPPTKLLEQFAGIFGEIGTNNFLNWTFGARSLKDPPLMSTIEKRMATHTR